MNHNWVIADSWVIPEQISSNDIHIIEIYMRSLGKTILWDEQAIKGPELILTGETMLGYNGLRNCLISQENGPRKDDKIVTVKEVKTELIKLYKGHCKVVSSALNSLL